MLREFTVTDDNLFVLSSTSKGNQEKWVYDNYYIKADKFGYESISEVLVSEFLSYCVNIDFVNYNLCRINCNNTSYYSCYSENFLKDNEEYVSFFRILKLYYGSEDKLNKRLDGLSGKALYDEVVSVIEEVTLLKFDEYLNIMLGIDSIILNEDRHFNNIGVIKSDGYWRYCPIFDNGLSLLSDLNDYPFYDNILFCMRNVKSMPFSTDFIKQFKYTSHRPIIIDFRSFKNDLVNKYVEFKSDEFERAKSVLLKRCNILEGKVWVQK